MVPHLLPGDLVVVRYGVAVRVGDVAVVALPGRPVGVKRLARRTPGGWEVAGDNPEESTDSRAFGPVPDAAILGRVVWRYWPLVRRDS